MFKWRKSGNKAEKIYPSLTINEDAKFQVRSHISFVLETILKKSFFFFYCSIQEKENHPLASLSPFFFFFFLFQITKVTSLECVNLKQLKSIKLNKQIN